VATRTGLVQADAEKRVNDVIALVKAVEAKVRQTQMRRARPVPICRSILASLMLIVAFIPAVAAALGGCHRDEQWRSDPAAPLY